MKKPVAVLLALCAIVIGPVAARSTTTAKTLYFHSITPAANAEQAVGFVADAGPTMDESPPLTPAAKVVAVPPLGNAALRKNPLSAWFGSATFTGVVSSPNVRFWASSASAAFIDVTIFENGSATTAGQIGRRSLAVVPGVTEYNATFLGTTAVVTGGLLVQFTARAANGATTEAQITYDSTEFPSALSFQFSPDVPNVPLLDDPFGIAYNAAGILHAANSGTGEIITFDAGGSPAAAVAAGFVPGGFARGATGLAFDGDGNLYVAVADTGSVAVVTPSGAIRDFARGLGTPIGLAFSGTHLYAADRSSGNIIRIAADGTHATVTTLPGLAYGLAFAPNGKLYATTQRDGGVWSIDVSTGVATKVLDLPSTSTAEGLAADIDGNVYIGDGLAGRIVRLAPDATTSVVTTGIGGPIMLAFKPGTSTLTAASQGEGASDSVRNVAASAAGFALSSPLFSPALTAPRAPVWVHKAGLLASPTAATAGAPRSLDPASYVGALPVSAARYTGEAGIEPTVGVQNDGQLYMVESRNPCSITLVLICGRTEVFRSDDAGLNWKEFTPDSDTGQENPPVSADPYIYVDSTTDRVYSIDLTAACLWIYYSDTDATSWTERPLGCQNPPVDHQTFVTAKPRGVTTTGYPNVAVICSNAIIATVCQRSLDGGDTWNYSGNAYTNSAATGNFCGGVITSHLAADPAGRLYLPRSSTARSCVSVSEDSGATWTVRDVSTQVKGIAGDHESRIASDSAGNLYYLFIASDGLPYLTISRDQALTWSQPKMVAPAGVTTTNLPSIAAGDPGKIVLSYMGTTVSYGYPSNQLAKAGWNAYMTVTTDALADDPTFATSIANAITDPIKRQGCGPGRCALVFDFLDVKIGADGRPWATFGDMCTGECAVKRTVDTSFTTSFGFVAPLLAGPRLIGAGSLSILPGGSTAAPDGPGAAGAASDAGPNAAFGMPVWLQQVEDTQ